MYCEIDTERGSIEPGLVEVEVVAVGIKFQVWFLSHGLAFDAMC